MGEILIEGVIREDQWERNHGRGIMSHGGTQEAPSRHKHQAEAPKRLPESTQEAPRRHPGGTQEAPRAPRSLQEVLGGKNDKTTVFYYRKWRERPFRVHETSATLTKYRKLQQKWAEVCANVPTNTS